MRPVKAFLRRRCWLLLLICGHPPTSSSTSSKSRLYRTVFADAFTTTVAALSPTPPPPPPPSPSSTLLIHHNVSSRLFHATTLPLSWHALRRRLSHTFAAIGPARRPMASIILLTSTALTYSIYTTYRCQQRQRVDPTSEWERYAQYPLARTMAMTQILLFQMIPLSLRVVAYQQFHTLKSRLGTGTTTEQKERYDAQITQWKEQMGQVFANGLLQLGPLYIKMGQILSCRQNLLPKEWYKAMERLQDQVPALTGTKAQQLAYAIWSANQSNDSDMTNITITSNHISTNKSSFDEIFTNVDWNPIAAASLGQVHVATLRATGERVALKLQRPNLRSIYDNDLRLLQKIAAVVDRFFGSSAGCVGGISQSWTSIFNDAQEILYREIDYRAEGQNAMRFAKDFGLTKGGQAAAAAVTTSRDGRLLPSAASWLRTPYVYEHLTTEQVLVMEYVPSIKISDLHKLKQANVTQADREYLADCLGRSYLRQFCSNRFCTLFSLISTVHLA